MRIYDCFTFFNELDLLEFRLRLLDPVVDFFVLAESNITHSGKPKPFYYKENESRFAKWAHKIIYIPALQDSTGMQFGVDDKYNPGSDAWKLENEHRNFLSQVRDRVEDNDMVILSDLDEMPNPYALKAIGTPAAPQALSMLFHYYFLNCQNTGYERWWKGSIVCSGADYKANPAQHFRDRRNDFPAVPEAGWHFSFIGGIEKIRQKLQAFAHREFATEEYWSDANIIRAMEKGEDIFKRPGVTYKFYPLCWYPAFLAELMQQYPALLHIPPTDFIRDTGFHIRRLFKGKNKA